MGQALNKQLAPIGVAFNKLTGKGGGEKSEQSNLQLLKCIEDVLNDKYQNLEEEIANWKENDFCHAVYEIVESINERSGAMQLRLPKMDTLGQIFRKIHPNENDALNKQEFQKIIEQVIKLDSFYVGQGAKDVFLYIFSAPIIAMFAKRMIPGPTASIPDEFLLPAVTSGTVYFLAKSNKL